MEIVGGLSLKNLHPRVWDPASPYYLPNIQAVMVSYAEFHQMPARRRKAMEQGLHAHLGVPDRVHIYLDNGAFYFLVRVGTTPVEEYEAFVEAAQPDWYPIQQDFIPTPYMSMEEQRRCLDQTMEVNRKYLHDGCVPVVHISDVLEEYIVAIENEPKLSTKRGIALGGIVPNLLRMRKARPYRDFLANVRRVRQAFTDKHVHLFGVGGTATLHLAALLGMDSVDSSGRRNRAARGIVQLPGSGDRLVADLGKWRGRLPSVSEWDRLTACPCPACRQHGLDGIRASGTFGFSNRAAHNLWVLLEEACWIENQFTAGTYQQNYASHLDNSIYRPLVEHVLCDITLLPVPVTKCGETTRADMKLMEGQTCAGEDGAAIAPV